MIGEKGKDPTLAGEKHFVPKASAVQSCLPGYCASASLTSNVQVLRKTVRTPQCAQHLVRENPLTNGSSDYCSPLSKVVNFASHFLMVYKSASLLLTRALLLVARSY